MGSWILRTLLLLICGTSGYYLAAAFSPSPLIGLWGVLGGLFLAGLALLMEGRMKKIPLRNLLGSFIGLILGVMIANLISNALFPNFPNNQQVVGRNAKATSSK